MSQWQVCFVRFYLASIYNVSQHIVSYQMLITIDNGLFTLIWPLHVIDKWQYIENRASGTAWAISALATAWRGCGGGGGFRIRIRIPSPASSRTEGQRETDEVVFERSHGGGSKTSLKLFFSKGHVSGQGQVKGQNAVFPRLRTWGSRRPHSTSLVPNLAKWSQKKVCIWTSFCLGI